MPGQAKAPAAAPVVAAAPARLRPRHWGVLASFLLRGEPPQRAAERALAGVHATLESTLVHGWEELDVLAAPAAALADGPARFPAVPL